MWCTLDADGYPDAILAREAPGNPDIVWMDDDDPKAAARLAGDTPRMRANAKIALMKAVDDEAERLRNLLITPGSGQAMEYQEAYAQAKSALADAENASASAYPMLAATIGIDKDPETNAPATDVLGVARAVKKAYEAYVQVGAAIKGARMRGKEAIEASATAPDARAAFDAIQWPALG